MVFEVHEENLSFRRENAMVSVAAFDRNARSRSGQVRYDRAARYDIR